MATASDVRLWPAFVAVLLAVLCASPTVLGQVPSPTNTTNTTNVTTTVPPTAGPTAAPEPPVEISDVFTEDPDSADSTRGMALAALLVSALSGNFPNGIVATRSALFLSVCIAPRAEPQGLLQFPVVTPLGDEKDVQYWFGAAVFNPVVFVALCCITGGVGLLLAQVRGATRREGLAVVHYPAHLAVPLGVMLIPGVYSATVAATRSRDPVTISMSALFGVLPWFGALATMAFLIQWRFRAVYVRRMETIDASGNVTTVRRRIRHDAEEEREAEQAGSKSIDGQSEFEMSVFSGGGTTAVNNRSMFGDSGKSEKTSGGDSLTEKMLGSEQRTDAGTLDEKRSAATGATGDASAFLENARQQLDDMVARETAAIEKGDGDGADGDNDAEEARKREAITDARKVAEVTDAVLRGMFSQAKRVGTDRLVLLYSVQGHFEWADDDEVDYEAVQAAADAAGRGYDEALAEAEEAAKAARGYVQRFGTFFMYYRRKFRLIFVAELAMSATMAFVTGFHPANDHAANCYIDTSLLFLLFLLDTVGHLRLRPHISKLNNGYFNTIAVVHCFSAMLNVVAAASKSIGAARAVNVFAVLLVYACALRALLDLYVAMTQRLYEAGVEWPSLATLTDMHIKYQRNMRDDVHRTEAILAANEQAHAHGDPKSPLSPAARRRALRAARKARKKRDLDAAPDDDLFGADAPKSEVDDLADATSKTAAEKWNQLFKILQSQNVASRVVPPTMLPFEMQPLAPVIKLASTAKSEAWERRRKEIKQRVQWTTALRNLRTASERRPGETSSSSSSSSSSDETASDEERPAHAAGRRKSTDSTVLLPTTPASGAPHHRDSEFEASTETAGSARGISFDESAFSALLRRADKEAAAAKRREALRMREEEEELEDRDEGGFVTTEDQSTVSHRWPRHGKASGSYGSAAQPQPPKQPEASSANERAARDRLLGGDLAGIDWSDSEDGHSKARADDAQSAKSDDFNDI